MHFTLFSDSGFNPSTSTCVFTSVIESDEVNEVVLLKPVKAGIVDSTVLELMGIYYGLKYMLEKHPNAASIEIVCDSKRAVAALNGDIGKKAKLKTRWLEFAITFRGLSVREKYRDFADLLSLASRSTCVT